MTRFSVHCLTENINLVTVKIRIFSSMRQSFLPEILFFNRVAKLYGIDRIRKKERKPRRRSYDLGNP